MCLLFFKFSKIGGHKTALENKKNKVDNKIEAIMVFLLYNLKLV